MSKPKNLLFIFTDEQRADTLGCYGNPLGATPAADRLARSGAVFEQAYCTSPVCTPSRGSIMTGLYPHAHGATWNNRPLRPDCRTIAEYVPDCYRRGYIGKWHLGDEIIAQHGFDSWVSIEDNYRTFYSRPEYLDRLCDYYHFLVSKGIEPNVNSRGVRIFSRSLAADLPEELTKAAFVGRETARFIRECGDQPFVAYANFLEPHMPFTGPLNELYPPDELPVGPAFFRKPPADASRRNHVLADKYVRDGFGGVDLSTEAGWRTIRARYMGLVTLVDRALAQILGALEESGHADDTIVVFTSDHGDMMGDHCLIAKGVMYEEATRIPLIVRAPGTALGTSGCRIPGSVSQVDLVPTLLDLMGVELPSDARLHGRSLRGVLDGREDLSRNDVFIEWNAPPPPEVDEFGIATQSWRTIVSEGWKLNVCTSDRCELYDLSSDPHELINRYEDDCQGARLCGLLDRLADFQAATDDIAPLPGA